MQNKEYLKESLTFDCGLTTAWAYWRGDNIPKTGFFQCSRNVKNPKDQRDLLCIDFESTIHHFRNHIKIVYLEGVQKYDSVVGYTSMSKGYIFELAYLIGRYEQICSEYSILSKIINAPEWKGQMSKEITEAKIKILNGCTYENEHVIDAVGMGFGIVGAFNWEIRKNK